MTDSNQHLEHHWESLFTTQQADAIAYGLDELAEEDERSVRVRLNEIATWLEECKRDCAFIKSERDELIEQLEAYREFYAAWWEVEKGVADFDLHSEAVTRLSEAHAAVIQQDSIPAKERS